MSIKHQGNQPCGGHFPYFTDTNKRKGVEVKTEKPEVFFEKRHDTPTFVPKRK